MSKQNQIIFETNLGYCGIAGHDHGVTRIILPVATRREATEILSNYCALDDCDGISPAIQMARSQITSYLKGERRLLDFPLDFADATPFDVDVYKAASDIPYGKTKGYGWVAEACGRPKASRAVGQAMGRNPLPLIIPCHRVIRSDGSLGGFGAGLPMKIRLLSLERGLSL